MSRTKLFLFRNYGWIAASLFLVALIASAGFELFGQEADWQVTVALLSIAVSFVFFVQKQKLNESKLFKELFQEFNSRYDEMNDRLQGIMSKEMVLSKEDEALIIDYFNLCSEEHLFNEKGYIYPEVWEAWQNGMQFYMRNKRIRELWNKEDETDSYYGLEMPIAEEIGHCDEDVTERQDEVDGAEQESLEPEVSRLQTRSLHKDER